MRKWSAQHFRATLQAYFLAASLIGLSGYYVKGFITNEVYEYFLISLSAVMPAIFLGRYLNHQLKDGFFFKYVYYGLIILSVILIISSLRKVY
jgi:hypothetical protein